MFVSLAVLRSVAKTVSHQSLWWETVILTRNCEPDPSWSVSLVSLLFFLFAFFFLLVFTVYCLNCNSEEAITAYKRKGLCVCVSVTERIRLGIIVHVLPLRSGFRSVNHSFRLTPHSAQKWCQHISTFLSLCLDGEERFFLSLYSGVTSRRPSHLFVLLIRECGRVESHFKLWWHSYAPWKKSYRMWVCVCVCVRVTLISQIRSWTLGRVVVTSQER